MIMMQNAHRTQLYLPNFSQSRKANRKQALRGDLVDWIRLHNGGWSTQSLAELFHEFFGRADPESYKQSRKSFDANELNLHCQALAPYATSSWMLRANFDWLREAFDRFIIVISSYVGFLQRQRDITAKNHASETPVRSIDEAVTVKVHKKNIWVTPVDKTKYNNLKNLLIDLPSWEPVDIEEYLMHFPSKLENTDLTLGITLLTQFPYGKLTNKLMK